MEEPRLVPVETSNIKFRGILPEIRDRLVQVKRQQGWSSWADMLLWVHENRSTLKPIEAPLHDPNIGFIVCRDIPLHIKDDLVRTRRRLGWRRWGDIAYIVLNYFEEEE
jgi:hypothetical protein